MNAPSNMSELFTKLNDLKSVFKFGEKLIPIVQSLIDFMRDTVPLLEKINTSISESTNKIPKATNQINDVTSATELATTEILDLVDVISEDAGRVEKVLKELITRDEEKRQLQEKIMAEISSYNGTAELMTKYFELSDIKNTLSPVMNLFPKIRDDAYNITLSLQVQDITSQQLAAVNHLIESVQDKLASLLYNFQETNIKNVDSINTDALNIEAPREAAFNPDARYTKSDMQQKVADSVMGAAPTTTQDEIDKLFS